MPDQPKVEADAEKKPVGGAKPSEAQSAKKPWKTPKVIVSAMRQSEAKGPAPTAELSPFFSPTIGTVNS